MTSAAKALLSSMACGLLGLTLTACRESSTDSPGHLVSGATMGTYYRVTITDLSSDISEEALEAAVVTPLERVDALMSTYKENSEVSRFNHSSETTWFPVATETATVVAAALEVFAESKGAFDITIAPLVNLWGFGPGERTDQSPDRARVEKLLTTIGSQHLQVRLTPPGLKKDQETLQIDLSGIAKGYAVDRIALGLDDLGVTNYLIDIGGEMRARGEKGPDTPWKIAIERPTPHQRGIQATLPLEDQALATSGDYRNFFEVDGRLYSHELDPRNGHPIQHNLVSVSVLASSCMHADAWATALIVLGPKEGLVLAEEAGLDTFMILKEGPDFREISSSEFPTLPSSP